MTIHRWLIVAMASLCVSPTMAQQPHPTPEPKPETKPAAPSPAQPTLDELLGINPKPPGAPESKPSDKPAENPTQSEPSTAQDQTKVDLDRLLNAKKMGDAFKQAITLMGDAATRLNEHNDPGLETQRVQEDAVKRLDQLLASLEKQKRSGSPSSSKSKPDPKQQPGQKKPTGQSQPQPQKGGGTQEHAGPTLQTGDLKPELESARAAWGSLPARVRDMLMQGTEDRFSARYKALTQEYYKRLAEENSK
jgi:hypothetical protein